MVKKQRRLRLFLTGGLILLLVYIFVFGSEGYLYRLQKQRKISHLKSEIKRVEKEIEFLEEEVIRLQKDPLRIEEEIRMLEMVKEGEYPVKFIPQQKGGIR